MKTLKNFMPLLALVLGIGLVFTQSAFKSVASAQEERWFVYTASDHPTNVTDAKQPGNYTMLDLNELPACEGSEDLCAIRATVDAGQPDISGSVATAIDDYFDPSPQVDPAYLAIKN
ncbi:DUF6520 family protein [Pedobacter namyangjuensis]|uniref:DUF6520 family protein n=1 Tax=Pedobacter namyangjuensis TaxID=600626 RepID=UPI000DE21BF8|nr:DUF6520 family protein [Pedobacter namyangjuensis]